MGFTTWDPSNTFANWTLSGSNLTATRTAYNGNSYLGTRSKHGKRTGKWYWEVTITNAASDVVVGFSDSSEVPGGSTNPPGYGTTGLGWTNLLGGAIIKNTSSVAATGTYANGDVLGIAMDLDTQTARFYKNGVLKATVSGADWPTGTTFYPGLGTSGFNNPNATTTNFGATAFAFTPPTGHIGIDDAFEHFMSGGIVVGGAATKLPTPEVVMSGGVVVGGAATISTYINTVLTGSGGVKFGGAAIVELLNAVIHDLDAEEGVPYGGMTMAGSAVVRDNLIVVPTGGMTMGGSGVVQERIPFIASGGMVMSGALEIAYISAPPVSGGMYMSGTPAISYVTREAPAGGMLMSGSPTIQFRESLFVASGGMLMQGSALAYFVPSHITVTPENPYADEFPGWALNMESKAATRYLGLPANSITQFMGRSFVANAAGIYEIGADTDAGQPINASIQMPTMDFGESREKRMEVAYIGLRTQGRMRLKLAVNKQRPYYYAILPTNKTTKGARIPIGKGLHGRYWTARLDNVSGADFELDSFEFVPYTGQRHGA